MESRQAVAVGASQDELAMLDSGTGDGGDGRAAVVDEAHAAMHLRGP